MVCTGSKLQSTRRSDSFIMNVYHLLQEIKTVKEICLHKNSVLAHRYAPQTSLRVTQKKSISCERRLELFANNGKLLLWDQLIATYTIFAHMILWEQILYTVFET